MKNYIKNFKNYTSKFKKTVTARTAILMGLTVSLTGCGQDVKQQPDEPTPGAQIVMETETKENKTPIETTVEEMIETETKAQTKENKTTKEPTTEYKAKEEKEEKIETETKAQTTEEKKETTTKEHQEETTQSHKETTQSHKETTQAHRETISNSSSPLTPSLKRSSRPTTEEKEETTHKTTAKVTTTKKPTTTTTTTKKTTTTTTTTQAPITEAPTEPITEAPTEPITEAPITYDYTLENITQSADVFNWNAEWLNGEILHNNLFEMYDCNGNKYCMDGNKESKVALLLLNENQPYNNGVLSDVFEGYSDYDIKNGALYFYRIADIENSINVSVDFNNYAMDKNVGTYMNNLKNAAKTARETGNYDELSNILNAFYNDENYDYLWNNYAAIMFTIGYGNEMMKDEYYDPETLYTNMSSEIVKRHIH